MISEIDPLRLTRELEATFRRYLYTANLISDKEPALQDHFWAALGEPRKVFHGPFIHCLPCYESSRSLKEMIETGDPVRLSRGFLDLPTDQFDPVRPMYAHQVEALAKAAAGRNLIVATGTGSGKTECFMLPVLESVFSDPSPGLRAIIVYPMNALANDQLARMRKLLAGTGVTFGRYTSDTPFDENLRDPDAPENERYTRPEMRAAPPHILLTNFAMLEYLLLRPRDADLFRNHRLRFIVLDEAHSYGGAQGIEISLLMRRLRQYLGETAGAARGGRRAGSGTLQFILTSATLGGGANDREEIAGFARDLCGAEFDGTDLITGRTTHCFHENTEGFITVDMLRALGRDEASFEGWAADVTNTSDAGALCRRLEAVGLSVSVAKGCTPAEVLHALLSRSELVWNMHRHCQSNVASLEGLCAALGLPADDVAVQRGVSLLVALGAAARSSPESSPLLPTRLHFFCRGLAGATVCLNADCPPVEGSGGADARWRRFYLEDRARCASCSAAVLPINTCVHCGLPAVRVFIHQNGAKNQWRISSDLSQTVPVQPTLLTWADDLDEAEEDDPPDDGNTVASNTITLCLQCQAASEPGQSLEKCCTTPALRRLNILTTDGAGDGELRRCPRCAGSAGDYPSVLRDFRTGEDAPTAVLTETLMRHLPFKPTERRKPANGRNLLVFSDSRQRAAFFAPYLAHTTAETAYLGPLETAIKAVESRNGEPASLGEIAGQYRSGLDRMPSAVLRKREDGVETYEVKSPLHLTSPDKRAAEKEALVSLFRHVCASTKQRSTLTGLGIAGVGFELSEWWWEDFEGRVPALFARNKEFGRQLADALLLLIAQRGAVAFPEGLTAQDVFRFGQGTPDAYTFHRTNSGRVDHRQVIRWNPYEAPANSRNLAISRSRHLAVLASALGRDRRADEAVLRDLLSKTWDGFIADGGPLLEAESWRGEFRLDSGRLQMTTRASWGACAKCGRLSTFPLLGVCLSPGCDGRPDPLDAEGMRVRFARNHYRARYSLTPLPLVVREHTAQLTNATGKNYQEKFVEGEVNVLSSSTTFEMGVDVGGLKAVLLRNVPPRTSSYVQRAGRAGRRKDGVSVAVTFARNVPHDQFQYLAPGRFIQGRVPVPYVHVHNPILTQRHVNSLLLGYFLRELATRGHDATVLDRASVQGFFLEVQPLHPDGATHAEAFVVWTTDPETADDLHARVTAILPAGIALEASEAIRVAADALAGAGNGLSVLQRRVREPLAAFDAQIAQLNEQRAGATGRELSGIGRGLTSLQRLVDQFYSQRLIDFLSSASWLPGYAFPQDNVKLAVRHVDLEDKMRLERDREVGISEYAPGAEVVADGKLLRSGAVSFGQREPDVRWYTRCPECRKIETYLETDEPPSTCGRCGTPLRKRSRNLFLKPDAFSTLQSDEIRAPGMYRKRPPRLSEVFLLEGADEDAFQEHAIAGIRYGVRQDGKMFRANSGDKYKGYRICRRCGLWVEKDRAASRAHTTPWNSACSGFTTSLHLAHVIDTDILQLRFQGCQPSPPNLQDRAFWLSFHAAFLHGCSDALGIDAGDLNGTFGGWREHSFVGEMVIYDRVPGGAGHIGRIVEKLDEVLAASLRRVRDCGCEDLDASCYACLRTPGNQFDWENLQRRPVINWLSQILHA